MTDVTGEGVSVSAYLSYQFVAALGDTLQRAYEMLAPSAARASISGRVTNAYGRAISGAVITVSAMDGASRAAYTNSFGYYRIAGLPVGESYVVTASARRYEFATPSVFLTLQDDLVDMNFSAVS